MATNAQEVDEYKVFSMFSRHLGYGVSDIENRIPPEPDILCRHQNGGRIAFELVEIIDEGIARSQNALLTLKSCFKQRFDELPGDMQIRLSSIVGNADIFVKFKDGISLLKCKNAIPSFLDYLGSFSASSWGEHIIDSSERLSRIVERFTITRVEYDGPSWSIQTGGCFSYPTIATLADKFSNFYETNATSIQLLAYFDLQPEPLPDSIDRIEQFIENNLRYSPFSDVWIYLNNLDKIFLKVSRTT